MFYKIGDGFVEIRKRFNKDAVVFAGLYQSPKFYLGMAFPQWENDFKLIDLTVGIYPKIRVTFAILGFGVGIILSRKPMYAPVTEEMVISWNKEQEK